MSHGYSESPCMRFTRTIVSAVGRCTPGVYVKNMARKNERKRHDKKIKNPATFVLYYTNTVDNIDGDNGWYGSAVPAAVRNRIFSLPLIPAIEEKKKYI